MTDPLTLGPLGAPYLAVDVQPDRVAGVFTLDESELDGPDMLAWRFTDLWTNVVCDVNRATYRRGATRLDGQLTQTEAGTCTITLTDVEHAFDPLTNGDMIHRGTPLRLRAWGYVPGTGWEVDRTNWIHNPRPFSSTAGWTVLPGTGGAATAGTVSGSGGGGPLLPPSGPGSTPLPFTFWRATWTTGGSGTQVGLSLQEASPLPAVAGQEWTVSAYVRTGQARTVALARREGAGAPTTLATAALPANTWTRLEATFTFPGGASGTWQPQVLLTTAAATGDTLDVSSVLVEQAPGPAGTYFDPHMADNDQERYDYTGASAASTSTLSVPVPAMVPWEATLFTGEVDAVAVTYQHDDPPLVTLTGLDVVGALAAWQAEGYPAPGVGAGESLLQRTNRVLTETGRPAVAVSDPSYAASLAPTQLTHAWQVITDATEAELGRVWVDSANQLVVRARGSDVAGPIRGTLSDVHGETVGGVHCCMSADLPPTIVYGTETMANRVLGTRRSTDGSVPATIRRDDLASQARYGVAVVERSSLELQNDTQVTAWAEAVIVEQSTPELRVEAVTPAPSETDLESALLAWQAVASTDLADRWEFRYHPATGTDVARTLQVRGVDAELTPDAWRITWTTERTTGVADSDSGTGLFVLDVSRLDGGDQLSAYSVRRPPRWAVVTW